MIGHEATKRQIAIALMASKKKNTALPHMLFAGAAGCGKTSMAREVAKMSGGSFLSFAPDIFKDYRSIEKIMLNLNESGYDRWGNRIDRISPSIIFLDEIHELPVKGQEALGIVMEEFRIPSNRPDKYHWVPYFTLIGATTNDGILTKPFRDRFKIRFVFEPYNNEEICTILAEFLKDNKVIATPKALRIIAHRSRGVPRIAKGYLERILDTAIVKLSPVITSHMVIETFDDLGIDSEGLTKVEQKILETLYNSSSPIGIDNLSIIVNESPKTLTESAEPFLIQKGLIVRSGKGRQITQAGKEYMDAKEKLYNRMDIDSAFIRT